MKKSHRWIAGILTALLLVGGGFLAGCTSQADTASANLSTAADNFEVNRRILFLNTWTDKIFLTIEGYCSLGNNDKTGEISVTCKVSGSGDAMHMYKKHFLGLNGQATYMVEQIDANPVDPFHYRYIIRPELIVPDIDISTSGD